MCWSCGGSPRGSSTSRWGQGVAAGTLAEGGLPSSRCAELPKPNLGRGGGNGVVMRHLCSSWPTRKAVPLGAATFRRLEADNCSRWRRVLSSTPASVLKLSPFAPPLFLSPGAVQPERAAADRAVRGPHLRAAAIQVGQCGRAIVGAQSHASQLQHCSCVRRAICRLPLPTLVQSLVPRPPAVQPEGPAAPDAA